MTIVASRGGDTPALRDVRRLFKEYQALVDPDISIAGFTAELDTLVGGSAPPGDTLCFGKSLD